MIINYPLKRNKKNIQKSTKQKKGKNEKRINRKRKLIKKVIEKIKPNVFDENRNRDLTRKCE